MDEGVREEKAVTQVETVPVEEENRHPEEVNAATKPDNAPKETETIDVEILVPPEVVHNNNAPKELVEEG